MQIDILNCCNLTDGEIDDICSGYTQNAAKVRFLKGLGLIVGRKANGKPLVNRTHYNAVMGGKLSPSQIREPNFSV